MATVPMRPQNYAAVSDLLALGVVRLGLDGTTLVAPDGNAIAVTATPGAITSNDITDATATGKSVLTAADGAAARTAIGAGTSNLALGATGTTALAGNGKAATAGAADTAITLVTGRTISATGGATGSSAAFNGSAAATIPLVLATPTGVLRGGVLQGAAVVDATDAASVITQLNALLASLRASGALAP